MSSVVAAADAEFCPYILPCLAGCDGYEWFGRDIVADADLITIQRATDICLLHLDAGPFFVGLVDDLVRLTHGLDWQENCSVLFFGHGLKFLGFRKIAEGSHTRVYVQPAVVARHVVELNAKGVMLVHSHPLGIARPSDMDRIWVKSVSEYLAYVGARLLDSLIVAGNDICSMLELQDPAEAWPELTGYEAENKNADPEPGLSDAELAAMNLAKAVIARHQNAGLAPRDVGGIVRSWMSARISSAIGVIALDAYGRPMCCEIIRDPALNSPAIVSILKFAVRTQAAALILVIHRCKTLIACAELEKLAGVLASNLRFFDCELVAVFRSGVIFDQITPADWETKNKDLALIAASAGFETTSKG